MAQENVEVVRQINASFNSGDIERMLTFIHSDFEAAVPPTFSAEPDIYRGHDGMRRYFDSFHEAMDDICFHQEDAREVGSFVVVAVRLSAKGRTTGIPVEQRLAQVWTVRDGKALQVQSYASLPEALQAAGLAE